MLAARAPAGVCPAASPSVIILAPTAARIRAIACAICPLSRHFSSKTVFERAYEQGD
ncbi:hypothetical protein [Bradyrhizobium sp. WD16]|uniref:hypothetical protein n=1 Tax=Bradyrhizobium sp. WD16 TaxID=1521768 RepID=UPI0020A427F1|nr:hypothetical protein [Bradyrhizobium sp. WD16]